MGEAVKTNKILLPRLRFKEFEGFWETNKFSKYIKLYRGSSPRPIVKYVTKAHDGVNWIKIGDTKNSKNYRISNVSEKITKEGSLKSRYVEKGEVILANSMSFGKSYLLETEGCIYDGWFVLREFNDSFDREFLLQVLNSEYLQRQYLRLSAGGVVQNISSDIVYSTILFCPSLPEQQKIASFLSAVDNKIQQLTKKKELLEQYKKGVMQQLFSGQLRFKDENGNPYPDWEEKRLKDLVEKDRKIRYGIVQPGKYDPDGRFMIRGQDYSSVKGWADSSAFFKVSEEIEQKYKKARVKEGDLLITIVGAGTGYLEVVPDFLEGANITQTTGRIAINKSITSPGYVKNYFFSHAGRKEINRYIKGQAQPGLNIGDVEIFKLPFPCLEEQQKIASYLSNIDTKIEVINNQITQNQTFKKGLLQQMFV